MTLSVLLASRLSGRAALGQYTLAGCALGYVAWQWYGGDGPHLALAEWLSLG